MPERSMPEPEFSTLQPMSAGSESDLGELAALFAAHSGGNVSAEVSAELALEIVLNEIVEQACLATGATGAAVILEREGEMVCRASSGINAPELGARLGSAWGLTAQCIKTRQAQRCDDALADPRADAEASRSLGVRSVMVLPLLRNGGLAGVLEVFSSRAGAFGERDELTLEALGQRILKNLQRASEPLDNARSVANNSENSAAGPIVAMAASELEEYLAEPAATSGLTNNLRMKSKPSEAEARSFAIPNGTTGSRALPKPIYEMASNVDESSLNNKEATPETVVRSPRGRFDAVTYALSAAVVLCAVLLVALVGLRVGWRKTAADSGQMTKSVSSETQAGTNATLPTASPEAENSTTPVSEKKNVPTPPSTAAAPSKDSFPPEGSLLVYENGKEVFRMPPNAPSRAPKEVQRASAVEPAGIFELSPEAAEGSLLHRVEPEYPEEARQKGIQGAVVLDVRIGRDGAIQEVKLVSGQGLLADAAIAAVKQWRFKPRVQAVEMQTSVTLNFRLPQ